MNNPENQNQPLLYENQGNIQHNQSLENPVPHSQSIQMGGVNSNAEARAQAERNMQNEVSRIIGRSNHLKALSGIISVIKILISSIFLSKFDEECNNSDFINWFILMLIHDGINLFYVCFYMIYAKFCVNMRTMMSDYENQIRVQYQPMGDDGLHEQNGQNNEQQNQDLVESQCKFLLVVKELNKIFYVAILLWAHLIYYIQAESCGGGGELRNLMLAYIIMGYIYIFYPILIVISLCLCLPCLLFLIIYFGGSQQKPADKNVIGNLNVKQYAKAEAPEGADRDCIICRVEYEDGDNIITLPCNERHYFHDECIKKWLKINGLCPVCRARLGG